VIAVAWIPSYTALFPPAPRHCPIVNRLIRGSVFALLPPEFCPNLPLNVCPADSFESAGLLSF